MDVAEATRPSGLAPRRRVHDWEEARHATWLEVLFDLVVVVAAASLASLLHDDHSAGGIAVFTGLLVIAGIAVLAGLTAVIGVAPLPSVVLVAAARSCSSCSNGWCERRRRDGTSAAAGLLALHERRRRSA